MVAMSCRVELAFALVSHRLLPISSNRPAKHTCKVPRNYYTPSKQLMLLHFFQTLGVRRQAQLIQREHAY